MAHVQEPSRNHSPIYHMSTFHQHQFPKKSLRILSRSLQANPFQSWPPFHSALCCPGHILKKQKSSICCGAALVCNLGGLFASRPTSMGLFYESVFRVGIQCEIWCDVSCEMVVGIGWRSRSGDYGGNSVGGLLVLFGLSGLLCDWGNIDGWEFPF